MFLLPQLRHSGKSSFCFQRALHSSTLIILYPYPTEGLISTGSPFIIFCHSRECTLALGLSLTAVVMGARRFVLYLRSDAAFFMFRAGKMRMIARKGVSVKFTRVVLDEFEIDRLLGKSDLENLT